MKKVIFICVFACGILPFIAAAQGETFSVSLGYGSKNTAEVLKLQQFLVKQGLLSVSPTGIYLSLTEGAVKVFQQNNGVEATGFFGPLTRAVANAQLASTFVPSTPSSVAIQAITSDDSLAGQSSAASVLAGSKKITWKTSDYPAGVGVNINLLRKTSDSPVIYELVRQLLKDSKNDGEEIWLPGINEKGSNYFIEVTCSSTYVFNKGCQMSPAPMKVQ